MGDGKNLGTAGGKIALDCSVRPTRQVRTVAGELQVPYRPTVKVDKGKLLCRAFNSYIKFSLIYQGHYSISTTDFFFPLVDSPYMQGRIGAANVLSDLYAEGVEYCDFMLMLLAASRDMPANERNICTREMIRGFRDACDEAEVPITGGQTVLNPWPIIGGVATSIVAEGEFVKSDGAQVGDVLVLTKPLGTQIAANVHQWRREEHRFWTKCLEKEILTEQEAEDMMHQAVLSMARLNRNGGRIMRKYDGHACTDGRFDVLGCWLCRLPRSFCSPTNTTSCILLPK